MIAPIPIGIEIGPNRLRALRRSGKRTARTEAMEVEWSSAEPAETVAALAERFGTGARIAVAVDTSALFVKRLSLPALPAEQRRRMVALDPERYFPVRDEALVAGVRDDDLVVAARAAEFDRMAEALARLGPVERVEPAPVALARHLAAHGVTHGAVVMGDPHDRDCAVVELRDGRVTTIRKLPPDVRAIVTAVRTEADTGSSSFLYPWRESLADEFGAAGLTVEAVPSPPGSTEAFAGASGALLGIDAPDELTLTSSALEQRQRLRAWRRGAVAVVALVAALFAAVWSVDLRRTRTLDEIQRRIDERQTEAAEVQQLLADIAAAEEEVNTLATVARERPDPLEALLLMTQLLPTDAHLRSLSATGDEWELDGYARDAALLVPTFEASDALSDVRFRTATTRTQIGNEDYESFSLALRYAPPAQ
jgi:Tfp pilus assembly protein PilN